MVCCGWTGRIFGHKFGRFLLKTIPPNDPIIKSITEQDFWRMTLHPSDNLIESASTREYSVRCVRCGIKAE